MFANICEYCSELSGSVQKSETRLGRQLGSWSRPAVGGGAVISQQLDCWSLDPELEIGSKCLRFIQPVDITFYNARTAHIENKVVKLNHYCIKLTFEQIRLMIFSLQSG